jgi:hypothetical protein
MLYPWRFVRKRGGGWWCGEGERPNGGGCGEVVSELLDETVWACWSLLSLKKRRAGSAGDDI